MVKISFIGVLFAVYFLFDTVNSETSLNISKCRPDNDVCIGKTLTKITQHRIEYSALKIPKLDPYTPPKSWTIRTLGSYMPVNFDGNWTNISIYGFDKAVFQHIKLPYHWNMHRDLKPIQYNKTIEGKLFIPMMQLYANFESELKLLMWPMNAEGVLNFNMTDVDIYVFIDCDVIQRGAKEYANIKRVHSQINVQNFAQHVKYENMGPFITHMANGVLDSNWKYLLESINSDLETHIGNIIESILEPIFDEVAIEEFTYEQSELELNPDRTVSNPISSNYRSSSSVIKKLAFSLLIWSLLLSTQ